MKLRDKVVIVTGSTTGIGKSIAVRCVEEGARVVIHGLESDLAEQVLKSLPSGSAAVQIEDISSPKAADKLVSTALSAFGRLDSVVNNAAWVVSSNIDTTTPDFFRKVLDVNTVAPFALIQAALPHLKETHGTVLNIGSVNAWSGEPNLLAYSVSKGALTTMTRNLGDALFREYGVRVNQINPGWILTEKEIDRKKSQGLPVDWYKSLPAVYAPAGRLIHPKEVAAAAVHWLSEEIGPISGQVIDFEQYPMIGRNPPKND